MTGQGCRGFFWGDRNVLKAIMVHSSPATLRTSQQYMATLPQTPRQPNSQAGNKTQSEFGTKSESPLLPTCWRARPLSQGENGLTGLSLIVGTEAEPELGGPRLCRECGGGGAEAQNHGPQTCCHMLLPGREIQIQSNISKAQDVSEDWHLRNIKKAFEIKFQCR